MQLIALFQDGEHEIDDHRDPYLCLDRIGRRAIERFDPEILFDPLKEQLDVPSGLVEHGNGLGGQSEIIGQKHQGAALGFIAETDLTQTLGIEFLQASAGHQDFLVAAQAQRLVGRMGDHAGPFDGGL